MLNNHRQISTQIVTDACCVYRREIVQPSNAFATILRGREIAYEAAHSPTIPSSMPNYTHDQIRELYGELDQKTRRLQENEYLLHTPLIDAWREKSSWLEEEECPLPKFRLESNDPVSYLSTGLSNNPRTKTHVNDKENIRGSFRTSIADRTSISPSPMVFNVQVDFQKFTPTNSETPSYIPEIIPTLANISELMDTDSLIDLDEETTVTYERVKISSPTVMENPHETELCKPMNNEDNLPIDNLIRIVRAIHDYHFVYDEINEKDTIKSSSEDQIEVNSSDFLYAKADEDNDDDQFEDLYERYITNLDEYVSMLKQLDNFQQKTDVLTPISEESVTLIEHVQKNRFDEFCSIITCQRQNDHIGHYGFELEQTIDGKIFISTILNWKSCPQLKIGDELLAINHYSTLQNLEQCHLLLHSFWHRYYDRLQLSVRTSAQPSKSPSHLKDGSISFIDVYF